MYIELECIWSVTYTHNFHLVNGTIKGSQGFSLPLGMRLRQVTAKFSNYNFWECDLSFINKSAENYKQLCPSMGILGNPGLQRGRDGKGETGSGKKVGEGEGKGKGKGEALGSFSIQIISRPNYFSEPLLASFLIKFKMRPMKSDHMLIWKSL